MNSQRFDTNTHTRLQFDLQSFVVSFGFEQKQAECPPIQMEPVDLSVSGRGSSGGRGGHVVLTDTRRRSSRSPESRKRRSSPANGIDLRVNKAGTSLPPNLHCAVLFKAVHIATLIALQEGGASRRSYVLHSFIIKNKKEEENVWRKQMPLAAPQFYQLGATVFHVILFFSFIYICLLLLPFLTAGQHLLSVTLLFRVSNVLYDSVGPKRANLRNLITSKRRSRVQQISQGGGKKRGRRNGERVYIYIYI